VVTPTVVVFFGTGGMGFSGSFVVKMDAGWVSVR